MIRLRFGPALVAVCLLAGITLAPAPDLWARKKKEPSAPPEEVYRQALERIKKKKYYSARSMLQAALPRIPPEDRDLLPRVQLAIADAFFLDKGYLNYGEALNGFRNFLTYYPQHPEADRAQFMVGMCLFMQAPSADRDQAVTRQAIAEFQKLEAAYAGSAYYPKAREKLRAAQDRLADHERLVGNFYRQRRAYRAAIKRYQELLDQYPDYSKSTTVLFELVRCHLTMGNRPKAEEALARLPTDPPTKDEKKIVREARKELEDFDAEMIRLARKGRRS